MITSQLLAELVAKINSSASVCGTTRVITIDGPAGSGKTSLAIDLAKALGNCPIVHLDDIYEGWTQDLISELPDRISTWIIEPLEQNLEARYLKYDWSTERFDSIVEIPKSEYLILEGVGAGNPRIGAKAALNIWIEADPGVLLTRLIKRDGEEYRSKLVAWQNHEAGYFAALPVRESAEVRINGD